MLSVILLTRFAVFDGSPAAARMLTAELNGDQYPELIVARGFDNSTRVMNSWVYSLADLGNCRPESALSTKARLRHWRILEYETDAIKGRMLVAGQNTHAPEIAYPLQVRGWHAIHFGLRSYSGQDVTRLQVKLSRGPAFSMITHQPGARNRLDEYCWKTADLTGQQISFRQYWTQIVRDDPDSVANPCNGVWLAYIKLTPLAEAEVRALEAERKSNPHRRLYAHHDAWSYTYTFRPTTEGGDRARARALPPHRFRPHLLGGRHGRPHVLPRQARAHRDRRLDRGPLPRGRPPRRRILARAAEERHRPVPHRSRLRAFHGARIPGTYRPAGFHFPVPEDEWNTGGVYDKHPEWRGRDTHGRPTPRLSYAHPEARRTALGFLREIASYPVDGVCIAYNRRPPLVEYEPSVVESFKTKYGRDPMQLDDRDPEWLRHRAGVLTAFMRSLREMLNGLGRRIEVSAIVMGSEQENLYYAMDVAAWAAAGLVDALVPYSSGRTLDSSLETWTDPRDAEFFLRIARNGRTKVAFNLMPRVVPPESYLRRAHGLYEAGADRLFFWDSNARNDFSPSWSTLRRLGHKEEVAAWARRGSAPLDRPGSTLIKLGGWDLRYETTG